MGQTMEYKEIFVSEDQQQCTQKPQAVSETNVILWYYAENSFILFHLVFSLNKFKENTDKIHLQKHHET